MRFLERQLMCWHKASVSCVASLMRPSLSLVAIDCQSKHYYLRIQNNSAHMHIETRELIKYRSILTRLSSHDRCIIYRLCEISEACE